MYKLTYHEKQHSFDPPREGYVADQMATKGHGVLILWVDAEYLREQTTGQVEVSLDGDLDRLAGMPEVEK